MINTKIQQGLLESIPASDKETKKAAEIIYNKLFEEGSPLIADLFLDYRFLAFH